MTLGHSTSASSMHTPADAGTPLAYLLSEWNNLIMDIEDYNVDDLCVVYS